MRASRSDKHAYYKNGESHEKRQVEAAVMAFIEESQNINGEKSLKRLFHGRVNELISHQMAVCGISERNEQCSDRYINIGFPEAYLRSVITKNQVIAGPIVKAWSKKPVVQIFNNLTLMKEQNSRWGEAIERHGIRNMIINGLPAGYCRRVQQLFFPGAMLGAYYRRTSLSYGIDHAVFTQSPAACTQCEAH